MGAQGSSGGRGAVPPDKLCDNRSCSSLAQVLLSMAADQTVYKEGKVPSLELKAVFEQHNLNPEWRKKLANAGWLTPELLGGLSEGPEKNAATEAKLARMFKEVRLENGDQDEVAQEKYLKLIQIR